MEQQIEAAKLAYFTEGNTYCGSKTKDAAQGLLLRYRLEPDPKAQLLKVACWPQDICYDKAETPAEREFALDEDGLAGALAWLAEEYARIGTEQ